MIDIRSKYHIALNDIGYVLQSAPESPAYVLSQATLFNNRLAQGDRTYDDFAQWWYWAQTDWWQGIKDETSWADDGKSYYSTNIDTWSEIGAIKLSPLGVLNATLSENIICGAECVRDGTIRKTVGTDDDAGGQPVVYEYDGANWTNISDAVMPTSQNVISQISSRRDFTYVSTVGNGMTHVFCYWDGTNWVDVSDHIHNKLSLQYGASRCHVEIAGRMYVFMDNYINDWWACVSFVLAAPAADADFTKVLEYNEDGLPVDACEYGGNMYYLVNHTYDVELREYNIAAATDTRIRTFKGANIQNWGMGGKLLHNYNGKLVITIPSKEIWEYDGSTLTRIYYRNDDKNTISNELIAFLYYGGVIKDNKIWWGNLMYDGTRFYNTWKDSTDDATKSVYPMFVDTSDIIWYTESTNQKKLYSINPTVLGSSYKGTADKNYLVFNNNDKVSGLDKIAFSLTLLFKKFVSGQSIVVEYNTGEFTSISSGWTALGTASYTLDGASATQKVLYFPVNTTYKKIWFRVKLNGDGTNTPALKDFVLAYLPTPFLDKEWAINIDCGDEIKLLNGSLENRRGRELKGKLEAAWLTRQILDFQDVDYAATAINAVAGMTAAATSVTVDDTSEFPEVGRLRIGDEIIYFTGKTPTTFTGLTRGQKGTLAVAHADDVAVHNGYKAMIQNFKASVPILNNEKKLEYVVALNLREII